MSKTDLLSVRIKPELKTRLQEAAEVEGKSMTTFILDAAEKELKRHEQRPLLPTTQFRGVPSFFRGNCVEASQGGSRSYEDAGWHLGMHALDLLESEYGTEVLDEATDEFARLLREDDADGLLAWFDRWFPKCMKLVPRRRRHRFADGVFAVAEDRDITSY